VFDEAYRDFWYGPHGWTFQFRCRICADPTGEVTDISVADAWPGGSPTEEEWGGYNLFMSRTPRGDALIEGALARGVLALEPSGIEALYECQPHQAHKKQAMAARLRAFEDEDAIAPVFRNLRLDEASRQRPASFHIDNYEGTRRRLRNGANREVMPGAKPR
jgi:coenzyme F420 hydrogenase subunit beta